MEPCFIIYENVRASRVRDLQPDFITATGKEIIAITAEINV